MSFLPPNHSNSNGNGRGPSPQPTNGNGRSPDKLPQIPSEDPAENPFDELRGSYPIDPLFLHQDTRMPEKVPDKIDIERVQSVKRQMSRLYMILIVVGLTIGLIVSVGIVSAIQRLGLTEVVPIGEPTAPSSD